MDSKPGARWEMKDNVPGFTAELSLYRRRGHYQNARTHHPLTETVHAAALDSNCFDACREGCWDLPKGALAPCLRDCSDTCTVPGGIPGSPRVIRGRWGDLGYSCAGGGSGVRRFSAILYDVPFGESWEKACANTPAPAGTAVAGRPPDRCRIPFPNLHVWGEWDIPDFSCSSPGPSEPTPPTQPQCRIPRSTKTKCAGVTLLCQDFCGPWEGGGQPIGSWYQCGVCASF